MRQKVRKEYFMYVIQNIEDRDFYHIYDEGEKERRRDEEIEGGEKGKRKRERKRERKSERERERKKERETHTPDSLHQKYNLKN